MSVQPPTSAPPSPDAPPPESRTTRPGLQIFLPVLLILVVVGALTFVLASGSSKPQLPGGATSATTSRFDGGVLSPLRAAPALSTLRNYTGQPVNLASYRGKAVFLTFLYTHCPDVCPLIASHLHTVLSELGSRARHVQLIAVSVDPRGDTPGAVGAFLHEHQLTGQMQYLIGSGAQLAPVWKAWYVGSSRDVGRPALVNHSALVYGISASGKLTTIYASNFVPSQIVHDVAPLLAS
ncbi:MAG TPA: SCO family protein [Solirubrobacteraceae bacterium]|nr:SCO family protein [Solirubrobacteraceae bacterium]